MVSKASSPISNLCRLCSSEVEGGFDIFAESEVKASLVILINKYLPIKVKEDDILPRQICEPCHIGVAATVDLIDRMVQGQHYLLKLYQSHHRKILNKKKNEKSVPNSLFDCDKSSKNEQLAYLRENEKISALDSQLPHTLLNIQGNTPDIEMDDLAKGTDLQKVYECHPMYSMIEGKRKKVRRKNNTLDRGVIDPSLIGKNECASGRPRRNRHLPSRYKDSLSYKEFDKIFTNNSVNLSEDEGGTNPLNPDCVLLPCEDPECENQVFSIDGNTITISSSALDESSKEIPAAVNIELDFDNYKIDQGHSGEESSDPIHHHLPKASICKVEPNEVSSVLRNKLLAIRRNKILRRRRKCAGNKPKIICELCGSIFVSSARFLKHMKQHKADVFLCEQCQKILNGIEELRDHQQKENHTGVGLYAKEGHKTISFECPLCTNKVFTSFESFQIHTSKFHEGEKPFVCYICARKFAYKSSRDAHIQMHQNKKPSYPCSKCDRVFLYAASLRYHEKSHIPTKKNFICDVCEKRFSTSQALVRHKVVHSQSKPFKCKLCEYRSKRLSSLKTHMVVHGECGSHSCTVCHKEFTRLSVLVRHMQRHNEEPSLSCSTCGKKFYQKCNLEEHMRVHSGVKPFKCSNCHKKFKTSSQANVHEKRYCKKFKCMFCPKMLTGRLALLAHQALHNQMNRREPHLFQCHLCERGYDSNEAFNKHLSWHGSVSGSDAIINVRSSEENLSNDGQILLPEEDSGGKAWIIKQSPPLPPQPSLPPASSITIPAAVSLSDAPLNVSETPSNEDIVYVFKKEMNNYQFIPFVNDSLFISSTDPPQGRDLTSLEPDVATDLSLLPAVNTSIPYVKTIYSSENQIEVEEAAAFGLPLKDSDDLSFSLQDP